jgi:drug/metabolite transporter superfamily protein YnfA
MLLMVGYLLSWHYSGGLIFERIVPDMFDVIGAVVACAGVGVIYYAPERGKINEWT